MVWVPKLTGIVFAASLLFVARNLRLFWWTTTLQNEEGSSIIPDTPRERIDHSNDKTCRNVTFLKELREQKVQQYTYKNQTHHMPTFFQKQVKLIQLARRQNYINPRSGCRLARWVVRSPSNNNTAVIDCHLRHAHQKLQENMAAVKENDTIYVPLNALKRFVQESLPLLTANVILITGQWQTVTVPAWNQTFALLVENAHVSHIFCMHKTMYAPIPHPKITSWPLGLNFRQVNDFQNEFTRRLQHKSIYMFYSKLGPTADFRSNLPSGKFLGPKRFYQKLHLSQFILAPSGRRPDSFRMYEAIGLGAKPLTNLDWESLDHFSDELDSVVWNVDRWNTQDLPCYALASNPGKIPNQRLVFDEYWMEYVERRVGRPLRWWDNKKNQVALLDDIVSSMRR